MIAVDAVFGEQFPVATDRIFLRSADDRHALGRLFRNKLEIITGAREIGRQVFAVGGKADEEKIAEAIETRCMGELLAWVVLIVRQIAGLTGDDHQPAGIGENTAVIHALTTGRRPLEFPAPDRPAVRTGVGEPWRANISYAG